MTEANSPPKPGLAVWLVEQACALREAIGALAKEVIGDREEVNRLRDTVERLVIEAERSAKVQNAQGLELDKIKQTAAQTQRQLNGLKIAKGMYKSKVQRILNEIETRTN